MSVDHGDEQRVRPAETRDETELAALRAAVERRLPAYLDELRRLVGIDCGSYTKAGVDAVGARLADSLRDLGASIALHPNTELGDTVVGRIAGRRDGRPDGARILLIGHLDTVFPDGTAAARPFRIEDGIATGPGVTDMKSGLLAGVHALGALRDCGLDEFGELVFVANPDEEIGSPVSTPVIRREARDADACLVLECARANGDIVSARKGIVDLCLTVSGRAAHAGVEPEKGRSAILEAAHQVVALHALNGRWEGVTCNVGVIAGGTRPNVVAETATLEVDLRSPTRAGLEAAEAAARTIAAATTIAGTAVTVEERARHWPMERLAGAAALVAHATAIARALEFEVHDAATGGASDANTTAGMGVPTLDGLGPIGGNDHSPAEYLELDSIVPRTTMLAGLILAVARDRSIRRDRGGELEPGRRTPRAGPTPRSGRVPGQRPPRRPPR